MNQQDFSLKPVNDMMQTHNAQRKEDVQHMQALVHASEKDVEEEKQRHSVLKEEADRLEQEYQALKA